MMEGALAYGVMIWALLVNKCLNVVPAFLHMLIDVFCTLYVGSLYSLRYLKKNNRKPIFMRNSFLYPLCAIATLVIVYLLIAHFGKDAVNPFLLIYFCVLGVFSVKNWLDCIFADSLANSYVKFGISISIVLLYYYTAVSYTHLTLPTICSV
eukprot:TRINITY_DN9876_c0_g3_i3.p1 TRINITY_DN9876_c0_g3~~TRINITY_DN9876_c0_g3_i3.p1  ORF type:complete len:152 (-),score=7.70 TRINITY_DN9876_c0_g3_i3:44-499(-)